MTMFFLFRCLSSCQLLFCLFAKKLKKRERMNNEWSLHHIYVYYSRIGQWSLFYKWIYSIYTMSIERHKANDYHTNNNEQIIIFFLLYTNHLIIVSDYFFFLETDWCMLQQLNQSSSSSINSGNTNVNQ